MGQTGFQGVKQDDVTVITLTLLKVHVNPFTGQWQLRGGLKEKSKQ